MSWRAYITNSLVNKKDVNGHVNINVLVETALMGLNGAEWAKLVDYLSQKLRLIN